MFAIASLWTVPLSVLAFRVTPNNQPPPGLAGSTTADPAVLTTSIILYLLTIAGILAVLFIVIGGFQYILSGANEELAERGKKTLKNAVIGLVIIILSYVIVNVIAKALGAT